MEEHTFHDKPNLNFNYSNTSNLNSLLVNYKIQFKDSFNNKANEFKNTNMTTYTQSNPYQEQQKKKIDEYEGLLHRITQLERENKELQMVLKSTSMNINNKEMNEISRLSDYNTITKKIQSDKEEKIRYSNRYLEEDNIRHSSKNKLITSTSSQYEEISLNTTLAENSVKLLYDIKNILKIEDVNEIIPHLKEYNKNKDIILKLTNLYKKLNTSNIHDHNRIDKKEIWRWIKNIITTFTNSNIKNKSEYDLLCLSIMNENNIENIGELKEILKIGISYFHKSRKKVEKIKDILSVPSRYNSKSKSEVKNRKT